MEDELPGIPPRQPLTNEQLNEKVMFLAQRVEDLENDVLRMNKALYEYEERFSRHLQFEMEFNRRKK